MTTDMTGDDIIQLLGLEPHSEGGHYCQVYHHVPEDCSRGFMSSIYFLLRAGERSHWHRQDMHEIWSYHAGSPVNVSIWTDGRPVETHRLGINLAAGERPQVMVPAGAWQTGEPLGDWSLIGCVVAPAFQFSGYELAPPDWSPPEHGSNNQSLESELSSEPAVD